MRKVTINFTDGKSAVFSSSNPEQVAQALNVDPQGTLRLDLNAGVTIIANLEQVTFALIEEDVAE